MTKFQESMSGAGMTAVSRLATLAVPLLIAALAWYFTSADAATKEALRSVQTANVAIVTQLATMSVQLARLEEQLSGGRAMQATIDAAQDRRLDEHRARIQRLEDALGAPF